MARILLTAFIADIRNSVAGTTFSKGRYGNYVKSKGVPVKQNTSYQNAWRNTQSYISRSWKLLTEAERTTWVTNAGNFPQIDKFGITFYLSGFSLYQQLNLNLALIDGTPLLDAPGAEAVNPAGITMLACSWLAANEMYYIWFEWELGANPEREKQVFYCTQPGSAGQMAVGKTTYFIEADQAEEGATSITTFFNEFFGTPAAGQKTFFSIKRINEFTGQAGVTDTQVLIFPEKVAPVMTDFSIIWENTVGFYTSVAFNNYDYIVPVGYLVKIYYYPSTTVPTEQPTYPGGEFFFQIGQLTEIADYFTPSAESVIPPLYQWFRADLYEALNSGTYNSSIYFQLAF